MIKPTSSHVIAVAVALVLLTLQATLNLYVFFSMAASDLFLRSLLLVVLPASLAFVIIVGVLLYALASDGSGPDGWR